MSKIYLSTGSNLGDRITNLEIAMHLIQIRIGTLLDFSSVYITEPWGFSTENFFLNQVLYLGTNKLPEELLKEIGIIENEMGRIRNGPNFESRIIDVDILFYDDVIFSSDSLKIPHPLLQERRFILEPLIEIEPGFIHPKLKKRLDWLGLCCTDKRTVEIYKSKKCFLINSVNEI